jgi:hypothetical protein
VIFFVAGDMHSKNSTACAITRLLIFLLLNINVISLVFAALGHMDCATLRDVEKLVTVHQYQVVSRQNGL